MQSKAWVTFFPAKTKIVLYNLGSFVDICTNGIREADGIV